TLKIDGAGTVRDEIAMGSAAPVRAAASQESGLSESEKSRLLDKVMAGTKETKETKGAKEEMSKAAAPNDLPSAAASLGGRKPGPSPMGAFWWLTVMIGAVGALAFGFRKLKGGAGA